MHVKKGRPAKSLSPHCHRLAFFLCATFVPLICKLETDFLNQFWIKKQLRDIYAVNDHSTQKHNCFASEMQYSLKV